jgi:hypothetical protein
MKVALSLVVGATLTTTGLARAQPPDTPPSTYTYPTYPATTYPPSGETPMREKQVAAPTNALELTVGTGYTQGFGNVRSGLAVNDVVTPGLGVDFGIGYRATPQVAVLWSGQYQEFNAERTSNARGFTNTIAVQYHFNPMQRVDPWIEGGAGYRVLIEDPALGPNLVTHGFQLGRVRAGLDYRASDSVALGPMIGADATMFFFQDIPALQTNIADPRLSTFVFAGLQGRFDIGGRRTTGTTQTISSR